jgi:hypothetical protein
LDILVVLATINKQRIVEILKTTHSRLLELLMEDKHDAFIYALLAHKVEVVLKLANEYVEF